MREKTIRISAYIVLENNIGLAFVLYSGILSGLTRCYANALHQTCEDTSAANINALTTLLYHAKFTGFTGCTFGKSQSDSVVCNLLYIIESKYIHLLCECVLCACVVGVYGVG